MAITVDDWYDKWNPGSTWNKNGLLYCPVNPTDLKVTVRIKTSAKLGICSMADAVETDDKDTDLKIVTQPADNSVVPMFWIGDTEHNREILARDNGVDSYRSLTKGTAKFTTLSEVDAYLLYPGMIISCKFANSTTVKPGVKVSNAGTDTIDVGVTAEARFGHILGQFKSEASLHWGAVLVTF